MIILFGGRVLLNNGNFRQLKGKTFTHCIFLHQMVVQINQRWNVRDHVVRIPGVLCKGVSPQNKTLQLSKLSKISDLHTVVAADNDMFWQGKMLTCIFKLGDSVASKGQCLKLRQSFQILYFGDAVVCKT